MAKKEKSPKKSEPKAQSKPARSASSAPASKAAKKKPEKVAGKTPASTPVKKKSAVAKKSAGAKKAGSPESGKTRARGAGAGKAKAAFPKPERNKQQLRERAIRISNTLRAIYGHRGTALDYQNAFQLLVATVLSAQATDEQVNKATPGLFRACPTPQALAEAPTEKVEELVRTTGFFRQKAKSIQSLARDLLERYGGEVPQEMEELTTLRGVGRKTANCVRGMAFGKPAIIVDTHFKRLSQRLALVDTGDPDKIEFQIRELLPEDHWTEFSNSLIWHGRAICTARAPKCPECPVLADCPTGQQNVASLGL